MRVEVRDVSKRFGALHALRNVSFEIDPGMRAALIGPNGAGKSTLIRVLMGMLGCSGEVRLDGLSPISDRMQLAHRMAYVPQIAPRLAATVGELLEAVARLRGLSQARICEVSHRLGMPVEDKRRTPFQNLSGGMRQKLLLALALSSRTDLLILDEPTASLDAASRRTFIDMVDELDPRPTLLLCSHRIEELRNMVDNVLAMQDGALVFSGSISEFLVHHVGAVLEVRVTSGQHDAWLAQQGFRHRHNGWWTRSTFNGLRVELTRELSARLGDDIEDLVVRDLESATATHSHTWDAEKALPETILHRRNNANG